MDYPSHAGGVIFYDEPITNSTALMQTTNGDVITQFDLHTVEKTGSLKIDLLSIEGLDRIRACIDLLTEYHYLDENKSLRDRYEDCVGIYKIERKNPEMWKMIHEHKIESLFQMEQQSGVKGIAAVKPTSINDLAALNAVIRLMAPEKGAEQPIEKFARFKENPKLWDKEMTDYGVSKKGQEILKKFLGISYGLCIQQEQFMMLVQQPEIGGFSLLWADKLRKSIAKKDPKGYEELTKEFFEETKKKKCEEKLCEYVWKVLIAMNRGYGFNASHTLSYSLVALQEMNLAYNYPIIFWDTANLIVDSGAMNLEEEIGLDNEDEDSNEDEKIKNSSTDYGKIAAAIGKMKSRGLNFSLPDINESKISFSPSLEKNLILYGLRGITRIGNQLIKDIILNRPYESVQDFLTKVKVNKLQMTSLIKSGAFDNIYNNDRKKAMEDYLKIIIEPKKRITLQNMAMLINKKMIPKELEYEQKVYNFNKYLKNYKEKDYYLLDYIAMNFYIAHYDENFLVDVNVTEDGPIAKIKQGVWDSLYKKEMNPVRDWMKKNQEKILNNLNSSLFEEEYNKYAAGTISKWEMDSLSFYHHAHELSLLRENLYNIEDFFTIEEEELDNILKTKEGNEIKLYKIHRIAGTVIDKDKNKSTVTILTKDGVVQIKIWKSQYAAWDKQLSERGDDGKKHVIEKSWFTRGTKLIITGFKREGMFIPKKYKNTKWPLFEKIEEIDEDGFIIKSRTERVEE